MVTKQLFLNEVISDIAGLFDSYAEITYDNAGTVAISYEDAALLNDQLFQDFAFENRVSLSKLFNEHLVIDVYVQEPSE